MLDEQEQGAGTRSSNKADNVLRWRFSDPNWRLQASKPARETLFCCRPLAREPTPHRHRRVRFTLCNRLEHGTWAQYYCLPAGVKLHLSRRVACEGWNYYPNRPFSTFDQPGLNCLRSVGLVALANANHASWRRDAATPLSKKNQVMCIKSNMLVQSQKKSLPSWQHKQACRLQRSVSQLLMLALLWLMSMDNLGHHVWHTLLGVRLPFALYFFSTNSRREPGPPTFYRKATTHCWIIVPIINAEERPPMTSGRLYFTRIERFSSQFAPLFFIHYLIRSWRGWSDWMVQRLKISFKRKQRHVTRISTDQPKLISELTVSAGGFACVLLLHSREIVHGDKR